MSNISEEVLSSFNGRQEQVWLSVAQAVSTATEKEVKFANKSCTVVPAADAYGTGTEPVIAVQFAFSDIAENLQLLFIPESAALAWASASRGESISDIDENVVADMREGLEGIVQGICLAVSAIRSEPVIASNLSIRHQPFTLPPNMARGTDLCKVDVSVIGEGFNAEVSWLVDKPTAEYIVASASDSRDLAPDGGPQEFSPEPLGSMDRGLQTASDDVGGLDLLLDIPLEISVELGRVKMLVKDVVDLGTGSIVEIQKAAGEPVDVLVNGRLVAKGEVVVIEDNFGVRITEILTSQERLAKLSEAA